VQSPTDEAELVGWLQERSRFLAIPRARSDAKFAPVPLGNCEAQQQFVFPAIESTEILRHVSQDNARSDRYFIPPSLVAGRVIQWNRTERIGNNEFRRGRFYIDSVKNGDDEIIEFMKRMMTAIQRRIRDTYPVRSTHRPPIYVGPDMARLVREGKARINPKGFEMQLVDNR
jgi:hypothetical protein